VRGSIGLVCNIRSESMLKLRDQLEGCSRTRGCMCLRRCATFSAEPLCSPGQAEICLSCLSCLSCLKTPAPGLPTHPRLSRAYFAQWYALEVLYIGTGSVLNKARRLLAASQLFRSFSVRQSRSSRQYRMREQKCAAHLTALRGTRAR
jgi:hypothetical protein